MIHERSETPALRGTPFTASSRGAGGGQDKASVKGSQLHDTARKKEEREPFTSWVLLNVTLWALPPPALVPRDFFPWIKMRAAPRRQEAGHGS